LGLIASITRCRAVDYLRERGRRGLVVPYEEEVTPGPPSSQRIPTPDEAYLLKQRAGALDDLLGRMKPELRGVFVLIDLERLTVDEVAQALGVPESTVRSRLRRARAQFEDLRAPVRAKHEARACATAVRRQRRSARHTGRGEGGTG
jgi:RNA polymerase sigma factor (sigma-70 family)